MAVTYPNLISILNRLSPDHKKAIAERIHALVSVEITPLLGGGGPTIEDAYQILGMATYRQKALKDYMETVRNCLGTSIFPQWIKEIKDLYDLCGQQIDTSTKMISALIYHSKKAVEDVEKSIYERPVADAI